MGDLVDDLETGQLKSGLLRPAKKMKKRRQLDALLKFRPRKKSSGSTKNDDLLTSSEDELFLPHSRNGTKLAGLAYANVELKHEVQNLSLRITDIEKRLSSFEFNRLLTTLDSIKTRLMIVEKWNGTFFYNQLTKLHADFTRMASRVSKLNSDDVQDVETSSTDAELSEKLNVIEQKSSKLKEVSDELEILEKASKSQTANMIYDNEKLSKQFDKEMIEQLLEQDKSKNLQQDIIQLLLTIGSFNETLQSTTSLWKNEINYLKTEIHSLNQTSSFREQLMSRLTVSFEELNSLVQNSSLKTSTMIEIFQNDIDDIRKKLNNCKCTQEVHSKPSVVNGDILRQSSITKPTINANLEIPTMSTSTTTSVPTSTISERTLHSNSIENYSSSINSITPITTNKADLVDDDLKTPTIDQYDKKSNDTVMKSLSNVIKKHLEQRSDHNDDRSNLEDNDESVYFHKLLTLKKKTKSDIINN
ncbi:unnamed protein product [Didymodactylos carnosus]|uniref:Uncharacterized protein n=1 Tax=Didymodactylos carnosus TaxID=1234261 RepID=A0A814QMN0_9BILA|nr:unnamed protein product [Didymodactylos carnosus]CAF1122666.1 unnamed protein product [Didymodactylos carnosus]CAF3720640.1 unnamed protein product [Didymodactylos carnosus]CAF3886232.1 unnamed protein product [Didymodactylos carnosus]